MKRILAPLVHATTLLYPVLIFFGLQNLQLKYFALTLLSISILRLWYLRNNPPPSFLPVALPLVLFLVATFSLLRADSRVALYYPVIVNVTLACGFAGSLFRGQTIVERIARRSRPVLPPKAIAYTRKVTIIWCLFFIINGAVSLWTTREGNLQLWVIYNGAISYILMGVIFVGEWLVRRRVAAGTT